MSSFGRLSKLVSLSKILRFMAPGQSLSDSDHNSRLLAVFSQNSILFEVSRYVETAYFRFLE
jgi:hypothetical protein